MRVTIDEEAIQERVQEAVDESVDELVDEYLKKHLNTAVRHRIEELVVVSMGRALRGRANGQS